MALFSRPMTDIEALDKELDRLHQILGDGDAKANGYILKRIIEVETLLMTIAKKNNGMETKRSGESDGE